MNPKTKPGVGELMELAQGFRQAKVLLVACKLDIFNRIGAGAVSAQVLADDLGLRERALVAEVRKMAGGVLKDEH